MKNESILLAIFLFVIGLGGGIALSSFYLLRWIETYTTNSSYVDISDSLRTLQALRSGETNDAIEALELEMNGKIFSFAMMKQNVSVANLKASDVQLIKRVREYRAAHPYSENPDIDRTIASILSLTNKTLWPDNK